MCINFAQTSPTLELCTAQCPSILAKVKRTGLRLPNLGLIKPTAIQDESSSEECNRIESLYHFIKKAQISMTALMSQASKVMLKILQARRYVNHELPDIQASFRKGRGTRDQIANIRWIIEKAREFQKNIYFCFIDAKAFDCVDHNKLWKILQEMGIPDHLTCLLRNLYVGQEATVRPSGSGDAVPA